MSETPPGSPGRRGNGLQAADYGALVDLDPRLAEALLARLADAGVAAYVEPAGAAGDPWPRAGLPNRPLDRLWVDPDRADAAREVVSAEVADLTALLAETTSGETPFGLVQPVPRHAARRVLSPPRLPGPPPVPAQPAAPTTGPTSGPAAGPPPGPASQGPGAADDDEAFRQIVAGFDATPTDPVPRWPVSEDAPTRDDLDAARRRPPPVDRAPRRRARDREQDALPDWVEPDALDEADLADPDIDGGRYVPPPPPPAPGVSLKTLALVGVLALGLVMIFFPGLLGQAPTSGTLLLGIALLGGGAVGLVLQVRDAPPHDTGPDDGAVV